MNNYQYPINKCVYVVKRVIMIDNIYTVFVKLPQTMIFDFFYWHFFCITIEMNNFWNKQNIEFSVQKVPGLLDFFLIGKLIVNTSLLHLTVLMDQKPLLVHELKLGCFF